MSLLGFIAGGVGDAGLKVAAKAGDYLEKSTLQEEANAAQALRDERLHALREQSIVGQEQRAPGVAAATATATSKANLALAPQVTAAAVDREEQMGAVRIAQELKAFKTMAPIKRQEAIDTEVAKVTALATPEMLKASRAIAMSKHIVDPSYSLIPNADGTVTTFDSRSGKSGGVLKDGEGKPVIQKNPQEMTAAVAVINLTNTNLKIAEAAYKVDAASLEPGAKEKAEVAWKAAQEEARRMQGPAYAVLYGKSGAKAPEAPASKTGFDTSSGDVYKDGVKIGTAKTPAEASALIHAPAKAAPKGKPAEEPTVMLPPGAPIPNDKINADRRAAAAAAEEAAAEEARQKRLADRRADAAVNAGFNSLAR